VLATALAATVKTSAGSLFLIHFAKYSSNTEVLVSGDYRAIFQPKFIDTGLYLLKSLQNVTGVQFFETQHIYLYNYNIIIQYT